MTIRLMQLLGLNMAVFDAPDDGAGGGADDGAGGAGAGLLSVVKTGGDDKGGTDDKGGAGGGADDKGADDKGGAGGAADDKGADDKGGAGDDKGKSDDPKAYVPEGLDKKHVGATDKETIDNLAKAVTDQPKAPEKPEGYEVKLSEAAAATLGDLKDDPVVPLWREVAHELNLNQDQFNGGISLLAEKMATAGLLDDPVSVANELKVLEPDAGDAKAKSAAAQARVQATFDWAEGMVTREVLTAAEAAEVQQLAVTAVGVQALEKIMKLGGEHGNQGGGDPPGGGKQITPHEKAVRAMFPTMHKD